MFSIYKITNLQNNKSYIGSSNDVERRWREHKTDAFNINSPHYYYPLQQAFRKYGLENFSFTILSSNYQTREQVEEEEYNAILFYHSLSPQGYNQTLKTHNALTDDKIRDSLKTKIVAINVEDPSIKQIYSSVTEASKSFSIERSVIHACLRGVSRYSILKGYIFRKLDENNNIIEPKLTSSEVINNYNRLNPIINGERHNIKEWCKIYKISTTAFYQRLKKGMGVIEALITPKRR